VKKLDFFPLLAVIWHIHVILGDHATAYNGLGHDQAEARLATVVLFASAVL